MGKVLRVITQKFLPSTQKSILINFRKQNGAWTELLLPPKATSFKIKGSPDTYYIKGTPDVDDDTNQRKYFFMFGLPYPINMTEEHPKIWDNFNRQGNTSIMLSEAEQQGYDRATLLKKKNTMDFAMWAFMVAGINLLISLGIIAIVAGV